MKPLLSICIAAYNVEQYIDQCLKSVFNQDFDDFEICLVDNGSSDKTVEICEDYASRFSDKIRFVKLPPPTKMGRASIAAAKMCNGEYLVALDSDDYLKQGALKKIAEVATKLKPDIIMYNYECLMTDENKTNFRMDFDPIKINDVPFLEAIKYIVGFETFQPLMWMYASKLDDRTKRAINSFSTGGQIHSDASRIVDFFLRYRSIYYINDNLYVYRLRTNSVTASMRSSESAKGLYFAFIDLINFINGDGVVSGSRYSTLDNLAVATPILLKYLKLAISETRFLNERDHLEICRAIEQIGKGFKILGNVNDALLRRFLDYINKEGSERGLSKLLQYEEKKLVDKVNSHRTSRIYVMPTGAYSEHTFDILKRHGINVVGFLDNSDYKRNQIIQGIRCEKPEEFVKSQNVEHILIVISSVYDKHIQDIKSQMISLGIKECNIIIRGENQNA